MKFHPCIDIHNGKVKQIVGGTLKDEGDQAAENFVSGQDAAFYADLYRRYDLKGGHIILLNPASSEYYEATKAQALLALQTWPKGLQIGGGINAENAAEFLDAGASHVIVTSYVFKNGQISYENLEHLTKTVGKEHLVLDLSCRKRNGDYYIVTDRWQKFTEVVITPNVLQEMTSYCDEFLIHAVDVEGKASGIETPLAELLSELEAFPVTYAGGVGNFDDLQELRRAGKGRLDVTIGSALDLFGGSMEFQKVLEACD
ncbi:MAG: phosphoribosylformimino-5-aminoimidazole carboxamide ribotide isomerase [Lachnospiraceae bacterium]|nr:phosphoribosylformimino-5-aminoimidazole carboxamide ribotide isomerase [Lachnospiraceae bacterium]